MNKRLKELIKLSIYQNETIDQIRSHISFQNQNVNNGSDNNFGDEDGDDDNIHVVNI